MFKRFVEGASILCLVLALTLPATAVTVSNLDNVLTGSNGQQLRLGLAIEAGVNAAAHYATTTGAVPDTVDWDRHGVVLGSTGEPIRLLASWIGESGVTFGHVQFKELAPSGNATSTPAYTWGDVASIAVGSSVVTVLFETGLWDSVRVWAEGSADGITGLSATSVTLE